jgi:hypothetical protein
MERLMSGITDSTLVFGTLAEKLLFKSDGTLISIYLETNLNIAKNLAEVAPKFEGYSTATVLNIKEKSYPMVFHNSLGWTRKQFVSVKVSSQYVQVQGTDGKPVPIQVTICIRVFQRNLKGISHPSCRTRLYHTFHVAVELTRFIL